MENPFLFLRGMQCFVGDNAKGTYTYQVYIGDLVSLLTNLFITKNLAVPVFFSVLVNFMGAIIPSVKDIMGLGCYNAIIYHNKI